MKTTVRHVQTQNFEGPIELLLQLIERRKMPINEVSLSKVTDGFIERIRDLSQMHYGDITQFIFVASTLVLIKSRSLLPLLKLTEEEEGNIDDLERRLKMYKLFQDLGVNISDRFQSKPSFSRIYKSKEVVFSPDRQITLDGMKSALHDVLATVPRPEQFEKKTVEKIIRIEDMMEQLEERIQSGLQLSFQEFTGKMRKVNSIEEYREVKTNVVVGFLAMLELVRNGIIGVLQDSNFDDMTLEKI